jgi:hypothetical protein
MLISDQVVYQQAGGIIEAIVDPFHNVTGINETDDNVRRFATVFSKVFDTVSHSVLLD